MRDSDLEVSVGSVEVDYHSALDKVLFDQGLLISTKNILVSSVFQLIFSSHSSDLHPGV